MEDRPLPSAGLLSQIKLDCHAPRPERGKNPRLFSARRTIPDGPAARSSHLPFLLRRATKPSAAACRYTDDRLGNLKCAAIFAGLNPLKNAASIALRFGWLHATHLRRCRPAAGRAPRAPARRFLFIILSFCAFYCGALS